MQNDSLNTVRYWYNVVNFLHDIHERHPIAHPSGWGMGAASDWCLKGELWGVFLWVQDLIDVLPNFLQWW